MECSWFIQIGWFLFQAPSQCSQVFLFVFIPWDPGGWNFAGGVFWLSHVVCSSMGVAESLDCLRRFMIVEDCVNILFCYIRFLGNLVAISEQYCWVYFKTNHVDVGFMVILFY